MTQPTPVYTRLLPTADDVPHGLGRHVEHHAASLRFAAPVLPRTAIASVRWTRRAPILDQLSLGSCTGNAAAGWVGTDNADRPGLTTLPTGGDVDEEFARVLYHWATVLDEFPGEWKPDDFGSSGVGAAKALQKLGFCGVYTHAFTMQAAMSALQSGPVMVGIAWYESMFSPRTDGRIMYDPDSGLAGGHELLIDELEVEKDRIWVANSWSDAWGLDGRAWFDADDLAALLSDDGDITVPAAPVVAPPAPDPDPEQPAGCLGQLLRLFHPARG